MQLVILRGLRASCALHSIQSYNVRYERHMGSMCTIHARLMAQEVEINYEAKLKRSRSVEERCWR